MNASQGIHLYDHNFQSQQSAKCDLLVRLSDQRLSYAIVDQLQDQLKVIYDAPFPITAVQDLPYILEDDHFLKFRFRKVKVSIETRKFTFIPSDIFSGNLISAYSAFFSPDADEEVIVTHLKSAGIKNIQAPPRDLFHIVRSDFDSPSCFTQAEPFIEASLKYYFKPLGTQLFLQFNDTTFEALVTEGKKVKLYNIFDQATADEFNYFLLLLIEQGGITLENLRVIISGDITAGDDRYRRVQKYFG